MAITEKFGQAVIGSAAEDIESALIQIHRSEINVASAYRSQDSAIEGYLRGLDIENRYMRPTENERYPKYGVEPAFFFYNSGTDELFINGDDSRVPEGVGRDQFLNHIKGSARIFSHVTGFEEVQAMWRVLGETKDGLLCHIDNDVTLRGLETLLGDARTLWLPDQHIDWNKFVCGYDEQGRMNTNHLSSDFKDRVRLEQIERHHMSIHKGGAFSNPLVHSSPGVCPELNMYPGTRSILTYDQA